MHRNKNNEHAAVSIFFPDAAAKIRSYLVRVKRRIITRKTIPYLLYFPAFIATVGILYPFFHSVVLSFYDYNPTYGMPHFIGIGNYIDLFRGATSPSFWLSLRVTLIYAFANISIQLIFGLGIALLLVRTFRGYRIIRAVVLFPFMIPPIIEAMMWKLMYEPVTGIINYIGSFLGMPRMGWLGDAAWALPSVIAIDVHNFTPFVAIILIAGLQSLPKRPFEAAQVDGASSWFILKNLTFPLLKPVIYIVLLFRLIESLIMFDMIYGATKGGPANATMSIHVNAYYHGMRWTMFGHAFAFLVILWAMVFVGSFFIIRAWRKALEARLL
ncbi:sugar ABC transporter permease [Patescibacteria group bacterium]|nr:sugar ABC transporter permease [Patescibacteria group bacterium]